MSKLILATLLLSSIMFTVACGAKKSEDSSDQTKTDVQTESKKDIAQNKSQPASKVTSSEIAQNSEVRLEFEGFIDETYTSAIDVMASQIVKDGPILISITFDQADDGGGSLAMTAPEFKIGSYEMTGEPMKAASIATDKYIFKSTSGMLNIIELTDEYVAGTISNIVFKEETNFNAGDIKLVSGSFKIPIQ